MSESLNKLEKIVGSEGLLRDAATLSRYGRDYAGHDLGQPLAAAFPATTEQAVALVAWARETKTALTPVGALTSFWASTRCEGRLVVDLRRMNAVLAVDKKNLTATVQAGISVLALHERLAPDGLFLPVGPDGYGDATIASTIANDTSAGHGMYAHSLSEQILSLTAVLGTGAILRTGAAASFGLPAFTRAGLPDLTGLLFGSEGSLGLVTEATLRLRPAPLLAALTVPVVGESWRKLPALARRLWAPGACHAFVHESWASGKAEQAQIQVASYGDERELQARLDFAIAAAAAEGFTASPAEVGTRWMPRPEKAEGWKGVSAQIPYDNVPKVQELWRSKLRPRVAGAASPEGFLRTYLGPGSAAALFGWSHRKGQPEAASTDLACEIRALLLPFGVPYRLGTVWQSLAAGRLDPVYRGVMGEIKAMFDPDGIFNPGVGPGRSGARKPSKRRLSDD